jgi:hypothetical protein
MGRTVKTRRASTRRAKPPSAPSVAPTAAPAEPVAPAVLPESGDATQVAYKISIRYEVGSELRDFGFTTNDRELYPVAEDWTYIVANRRRITAESRDTLAGQIFERFAQLANVDGSETLRRHVGGMARADYVEIELPSRDDDVGWVARAFPWEAAIALLTKPERGEHVVTILRHLNRAAQTGSSHDTPSTLLAIRSGPGKLGELFELDAECRLVVDALPHLKAPAGLDHPVLAEPDYERLKSAVTKGSPSVVHLAAVDPQTLLWNKLATPEVLEGIVMRGETVPYDAVGPKRLAEALTAGTVHPHLVAVSTCFSAARVAPMIVAHGARHAIGFQDLITDADAALFFGAFYRLWGGDAANIRQAFRQAHVQCQRQSGQQPSSAVLWSDRSLLRPGEAGDATKRPRTRAISIAKASDLKVHVEPMRNLNYSLLHNNRDVFEKLFVDKPCVGELPPLRVDVALEAGTAACRCRFSQALPIEAIAVPLAERVRLPLVADLLRRCSESLRTNLNLKIECGDTLVCENTYRVTILPADEWRDDGKDHCWLPSFVLPRDPAVLRLVTAAQRYLRTLLDDCGAGFDGYQRVSQDQSNAPDIVDPQVQAIWAALQYDLPLAYINPPPAYTSLSQRLRSPTQIFEGRAATCIDLALLFASCLEFVGIYPAIFLVTGHAFPGYWRSASAWGEMLEFRKRTGSPSDMPQLPGGVGLAATRGQGEGWMLTAANLRELLSFVQAGFLVPFESTHVTHNRGFFEALEVGPSLLHPESFDAMIDIQLARADQVTPLPLVNGGP